MKITNIVVYKEPVRRLQSLAQALVLILQTGLSLLTGYLVILTLASRKAAPKTRMTGQEPVTRFLVIIPAHNEAQLIGATLESLSRLDYPTARYSVHVIADNCTDQTAQIAAEKGAIVHVRTNHELVGKGYALQWLLDQLNYEGAAHDALLFIDADSTVSANLLKVMDARLAQGEKVIQAYYAVREPEKSWNGALRYAALAVLHYLRPQGRMVLGTSAGLKGNGMVLAAETMRKYHWSGSLTEDIELHMALIGAGERVVFAPDAIVWGEMPDTLSKMRSQHTRWEQGRLQMARQHVPQLVQQSRQALAHGEKQRAFTLLDAVMEHLIPPFSVLFGLTGLSLGAGLALSVCNRRSDGKPSGNPSLFVGIGLLLAQTAYLLVGLRQVHAPRSVYTKLLYAPILILWKLKQYSQTLFQQKETRWVRTQRNGD